MRNLSFLLLFSLFAITSTAQEKIVYDAHAEERKIPSFHAIEVSHGIDLLIRQGDTEALAISAETSEQRDAVVTEVEKGVLKIYIHQKLQNWWKQLRDKGVKVKAYLSFRNIDRIDGASGAKISIDGTLNSPALDVELSSGASLKGTITGTNVRVGQGSGSVARINGTVQELDVRATSGAHYYGYDLKSIKSKARAASGGKIELFVSSEMEASASSGGSIEYKGDGVMTKLSTSSGGKIRKA